MELNNSISFWLNMVKKTVTYVFKNLLTLTP